MAYKCLCIVSLGFLILAMALNTQAMLTAGRTNAVGVKVLSRLAKRVPYEVADCQNQSDDDYRRESQQGYRQWSLIEVVTLELSGGCQQAKDMLVKMVEQQPDNRVAWLALGDVLFALGEPQQARFAWREAKADVVLAGRGRYAEMIGDTINAELWLAQASQVEDSLAATLDLIDLYMRQGHKAEALQVLQSWVQRTGEDRVVHWFAAAMLAELDNRWADAIAAYQRGLALNQDDYDFLRKAKAAMERQRDWETAIVATKRLLKLVPHPHEKWWMLEIALDESYLGNYGEAVAWARQAQQGYQGPAWEPLDYLGRVACVAGDLSSAKEYFGEGLRLSPDNWRMLYRLGVCIYSLSGDGRVAQDYLEQAIRLGDGQPGIGEVYIWLADLYMRSDEIDRAVTALERVLALDPGNTSARHRLDSLHNGP